MGEKTYTVKQVSEMSGASIRALHHYEELGLLVPQRRPNGYRAYDSNDIAHTIPMTSRVCSRSFCSARVAWDLQRSQKL